MAQLTLDQGLALLEKRARITRWLLFAFMIFALLTMCVSIGEASGAIEMEGEALGSAEMAAAFIYIVYLIALLAAIVSVSTWIYRAHANLHAAGFEDLRYTPGWAVGWYFVPFANLFKPFEAMRELWNSSTANAVDTDHDGHLGPWWGSWILGNILSNIGARMQGSSVPEMISVGYVVDTLGGIGLIAAAFFLAQIVRKVTAAQGSVMGIAEVFA